MKLIYKWTLFFLSIAAYSSAQVGINTTVPQGVLHIDAMGNNNKTGAPSAAQTTDDVLISPIGNIAVGHINPTYKVDIRVPSGAVTSAFRLEDGTEGSTKMLLSDASGNAYWGYGGSTKAILGVHTQSLSYTIPNVTLYIFSNLYANAYVQLPPGRWVVMVDERVEPNASSYTSAPEQRGFCRFTFSDNNLNGDGNLIPANGAGVSKDVEGSSNGTTSVGALISGSINFRTPSIVSGFVIINNKTAATKTYYLKLVNAAYPSFQNESGKVLLVCNPVYSENKITAMPLQ